MEETSLEVLLDLWVVLFGEDVLWDDAVAKYVENENIGPWYGRLTNAGLLDTQRVGNARRILVVKGGDT